MRSQLGGGYYPCVLDQAIEFRNEGDALFGLLDNLGESDWSRETQFKHWTPNDIIAHLHMGDYAADQSLQGSDEFRAFGRQLAKLSQDAKGYLGATHAWLGGIKNRDLLLQWRAFYREMADRFALADPRKRVKWFGPDMSVLSSISARLMETWAHGQALYDLLGETRVNTDRIKNIAIIGINTYRWTFSNRGIEPPGVRPNVRLTGPSGAIWEWLQADSGDLIEGPAEDFCQVVTQTRNVADTSLRISGQTAVAWMAIAQCFAGPPQIPPPPGARFRQTGSRPS
ncbi:MAG: TIGR03084 family metal-binding protein [Candidatus Binataceae bacterium]